MSPFTACPDGLKKLVLVEALGELAGSYGLVLNDLRQSGPDLGARLLRRAAAEASYSRGADLEAIKAALPDILNEPSWPMIPSVMLLSAGFYIDRVAARLLSAVSLPTLFTTYYKSAINTATSAA